MAPQNQATLTVLPDQLPGIATVLTTESLREDLAWISPDHLWQIRELTPSEFSVVFSSAESLRLCCTLDESFYTLPLTRIRVSIRPSAVIPSTIPALQSVWVRLYGLPE